MKNLILAFACLFWVGCDNPFQSGEKKNLEDPIIRKEGGENLILAADIAIPEDTLVANERVELTPAIKFATDVDTSKVKYTWSISEGGLPVSLDDAADKILKWIPTKPGRYSAQLTIEYDGRKVQIFILVVIYAGNDDAAKLAWFQDGIVGKWHGTSTTPWVPPYGIEMEFRKNGTYSARNVDTITNDSVFHQPALYYGTDTDSDLKRYNLDDVMANGEATGEIVIFFHLVGTTTLDELRHLRLSEDKNRLSFELWHFGHGPVRVELTRTP